MRRGGDWLRWVTAAAGAAWVWVVWVSLEVVMVAAVVVEVVGVWEEESLEVEVLMRLAGGELGPSVVIGLEVTKIVVVVVVVVLETIERELEERREDEEGWEKIRRARNIERRETEVFQWWGARRKNKAQTDWSCKRVGVTRRTR